MQIDRIANQSFRALLALMLSLPLVACDNPVEEDEDHEEAAGLVVEDTQGAILASVDQNRAVTGSITVQRGQSQEIRVFFLDEHGDRLTLDGSETTLQGTVQNTAVATWTKLAEDQGRIAGGTAGSTTIVFDLMHGGHPDYTAPGIPLTVTQ